MTQQAKEECKRREWVYVQRPKDYEMAPCSCGNADPDWSEWEGMLWCHKCGKDFVPAHGGIFDGPIAVQACELLGIYFDRIDVETGELLPNEHKQVAEGGNNLCRARL